MLQYPQMSEESDIQAELDSLPKGTIVRRTIRGTDRFYHQWRENGVTKSRYLSPGEIMPLRAQLERRHELLSFGSISQKMKQSSKTRNRTFQCDVRGASWPNTQPASDTTRNATVTSLYSTLRVSKRGLSPVFSWSDRVGRAKRLFCASSFTNSPSPFAPKPPISD